MSLRSIAQQYHAAANYLALRGEKQEGGLTDNQRRAIESYRDSATKVEALIRPEDEQSESTWNLEAEAEAAAFKTKVTAADKAATPQELLKKANK